MSQKDRKEDTHFYLDHAPPQEVINVLRVLSVDSEITPKKISETLRENYGFRMQKDHTYSPRRLFDLGLAFQNRKGSGVTYRLTELGLKIQNILSIDLALGLDLLHYLHYTGYTEQPEQRKYLWSYRKCCELIWANKRALSYSQFASTIQAEMRETFQWLDYGQRAGARFDSTAASRVLAWIRALEPAPIDEPGGSLNPRNIDRFEIALLALDEAYRTCGYTYGDPVLLDDEFIQQVAGVFFLDNGCCTDLLRIGVRISESVRMSETLAGISINLTKPFNIYDL